MLQKQAELAAELIDLAVPLGAEDSQMVRGIVGSKWEFMAGTVQLEPIKIFKRQVPFHNYHSFVSSHGQREAFVRYYKDGKERIGDLEGVFQEPGMSLNITAYDSHEGRLVFTQRPETAVPAIPQVSTADVGRMMLVNETLIDHNGMGNMRPHRNDLAEAMIAAAHQQLEQLRAR